MGLDCNLRELKTRVTLSSKQIERDEKEFNNFIEQVLYWGERVLVIERNKEKILKDILSGLQKKDIVFSALLCLQYLSYFCVKDGWGISNWIKEIKDIRANRESSYMNSFRVLSKEQLWATIEHKFIRVVGCFDANSSNNWGIDNWKIEDNLLDLFVYLALFFIRDKVEDGTYCSN